MSTSRLCPCPACNRHVKTGASVCPFCEAALPGSRCELPAANAARPRLSRAARLLAGATLMGVSACSSIEMPPAPAPTYGGPPIPVDAEARQDTGAGGAAGSDAAAGTGGAPSTDAASDRTVIALYGGPPINRDAGG